MYVGRVKLTHVGVVLARTRSLFCNSCGTRCARSGAEVGTGSGERFLLSRRNTTSS